jgi:hypothetical protein
MMIISSQGLPKDIVPREIISNQGSMQGKHDSILSVISRQRNDSIYHKAAISHFNITVDITDTTSVCNRNSISDVTFYDRNNIVFQIHSQSSQQLPFIFIENYRQKEIKERSLLIKHLRPGNDIPANPLHADWIILIILVAAFLSSLVRSTSGSLSSGFGRFFLFRGINDPVSRDHGGLFHWQSTILNLISFLIIGLFGYYAALYYYLVPTGSRGILIWLIALGIIASSVTLRHITCVITGSMSGRQEVFREYLLGVYQSYRFGAFFLSVIIILMSYTHILPLSDFIISGIIIFGLMYLIRVIRLSIIFLNRNISIFYLILYLCALEILPVLIIVKYFTGLV